MQTHFEKMHFTVKISYKISYNLVTLPKNPNFRHFFRKMLDDFRKVRYNKNSENNVELLSLVLLSPFFCSTHIYFHFVYVKQGLCLAYFFCNQAVLMNKL